MNQNNPLQNTVANHFVGSMPNMIKVQIVQQAKRHNVNLNAARVENADGSSFLIGDAKSGRVIRVNSQAVTLV